MSRFLVIFLATTALLAGCDTAADNGTNGSADAADDVAGTDATNDAAGNELPLVDASADAVLTDAASDVAVDAGPDASTDVGPDIPNNGCCQNDLACPKGSICIPGKNCVAPAPTGKCWFDGDCKSAKCENPLVCPCTADCSFNYSFGTCSDNPGSCCGGDKGGCLTGETCVQDSHICKASAVAPGSCWSTADCKTGACQGAIVCPCGAMCKQGDKLGTCQDVKPGGCCKVDSDCASGEECANHAMCKAKTLLGKGQCWSDADCGGGTCAGVNVCPCGAMCLVADKPGTCSSGPTTCTTVDPGSFGLCAMLIGVVFDGKSCVSASGCGCGTQCSAVFADLASCQKACGI